MTQTDYDSILTATNSNIINSSPLYAAGQKMAELDVAMIPRNYMVSSDPLLTTTVFMLLIATGLLFLLTRKPFGYLLQDIISNERRFDTIETHYKDLWVFCSAMFIAFSAYFIALVHFGHDALRFQFSPSLGIPYWLLATETVVFAAMCYAKFGLYTFVGWIFFDSSRNRSWMVNYLLLTALASLLMYPISLLAIFSDIQPEVVNWCYLFAAVLYELLLVFRLFVNFRTKKYGVLLMLLYFCSVEVVPALVVWHYIDWASDILIEAYVLY